MSFKKISLRFFLFSFTCFIGAACSSTQTSKTITSTEKAQIKKYKKLVSLKDGRYHVLLMTSLGNMVLKLYNETPLHRNNFVNLVSKGSYDSLIFHRVINEFMIQGGDPNTRFGTVPKTQPDNQSENNRIPAEFRTEQGIFHKRGALAAARDNNPEKASSNSQFYIVQRHAWRVGQLDSTIAQRKLSLTIEQKKLYTSTGGTPHLDGNYTVFGELELGFDVLDSIAQVPTGNLDRPNNNIFMKMFLLNKSRILEHKASANTP